MSTMIIIKILEVTKYKLTGEKRYICSGGGRKSF
jgi:hypothetical protein